MMVIEEQQEPDLEFIEAALLFAFRTNQEQRQREGVEIACQQKVLFLRGGFMAGEVVF